MRRPERTAGAAALALALCLLTPGGATLPLASAGARTPGGTPAGPAPAPAGDVPGDEWERADPDLLGFDTEVLAEKVEQAGATGASCFVVVRRGRLVGEWYWHGTDPSAPQPVFSVTKSVASTLVGMAQADGLLNIDDRMSDYIPSWRGTSSEDVTIRQVLSNTSGRHWDYLTDYPALAEAEDANELALGVGQDGPPGTEWVYNNAAIQALDVVLSTAIGDVAAYAEERLFEPLGMHDTRLAHDEAGNTRLNVGLSSTCRDLARFGHLFLRHGDWGGEQVVPASWVRLATGRSSQRLNAAYGLLWWLNRPGTVIANGGGRPAEEGVVGPAGDQLAPGAPRDMFWAIGMGDQLVQVDPGSETVLVRLAPEDPESGSFYPVSVGAAVIEDALVDGGRRLP
jgi:CubicO group peptidase (beta-lactamase class C family)